MIKRWVIWGLFALISVAVLISSLGTAFQTLPLNPDMAEMALIYQGVIHHGWRFPFTWRFTQDNQILSLLPFTLIYYALASVSGASIIIQGWLIFVVNALLAGLLVKTVTHSWRWAALSWLLSLLASPMAIGQPGILAYPVTHNSVWAFGLLGIIGLIRYLSDRPNWALPLILMCVAVGTISDPWFEAAFTVPVLLIAWKAPRWFQTDKTTRRTLVKSLIITYIAGRITYFGLELLHMVPGQGLGIASFPEMFQHIKLLAQGVGVLVQLYPLPKNNYIWSIWVIYFISLCSIIIFSWLSIKNVNTRTKILVSFSGISIGIIVSAFIITNFAGGLWASRFLINLFYLIIVIITSITASFWLKKDNKIKILYWLTLLGYTLLAMHAINHANWRYKSNWNGTDSLSRWLIKHDFYNGYGQYFDVNSPLLNIVSSGKITARPLSCNMGYLIPRLSSSDDQFWFGQKPLAQYNKLEFIAFNKTSQRWNKCAIKTFGKPYQVLFYRSLKIFIYNRNLSSQLNKGYRSFQSHWKLINIANNRTAINKVGKTLGVNSEWAQYTYTWLLKNGIAK
ncbi:hypothetical protein HF673_14070 [Acidithiobacillus thiooxidans]|uniref:hypothetical protein n=1 Tax=Acidithiobacillus thiooxidans TaxID=930 RepID=UPI001C07308C|nr:hypothetical protein [Acidithiobacillus thiooxidans]MBU2836858.1 hypothetical protein [Acidithiobacillus thiooxidans]